MVGDEKMTKGEYDIKKTEIDFCVDASPCLDECDDEYDDVEFTCGNSKECAYQRFKRHRLGFVLPMCSKYE